MEQGVCQDLGLACGDGDFGIPMTGRRFDGLRFLDV